MPDFSSQETITPLQQIALDRIKFFEAEFAKRGLIVRMSLEQEFTAISDENLHRNTEKLQSLAKQHFSTLQSLSTDDPRGGTTLEARFGNSRRLGKSIEDTLKDVIKFRAQFASLVKQSGIAESPVAISFDPIVNVGDKQEAQSLHGNYSVYDRENNNLDMKDAFQGTHAKRLAKLQEIAGLAYIQDQKSLDRLHSKINFVPTHIGHSICEDGRNATKHNESVKQRRVTSKTSARIINGYVEDRLPSANADPYIIVALDLAALYDVVVNHPALKEQQIISANSIASIKPGKNAQRQSISLGADKMNIENWASRFEKSGTQGFSSGTNNYGLISLLGKDLYDGILSKYGKMETSASLA